jgi:hypothetical protein
MRKYIHFYICCLAALAISCENDEQTSLSVDYTPTPLAAAGGETSFTVHTSGNWTASKTTSWVKLSSASGNGDQTVTVTVPGNEDDTQNTPVRTAKIYILSGAHTETLTITQLGGTHPVSPAPVITGSSVNQCPTLSVALEITPVQYALSYVWYKDGEVIPSVTATSYTVAENGTYTVAGVNIAGEAGELSADHTVTIIPCFPAAAGAIGGANANSCSASGSTLTADNTVTLTIPEIDLATSYTWYYNGGSGDVVVQTGTSRSYTAYISGSYTVEGVNTSATGTRSPVKVVNITPCFTFTSGGNYYRIECNATTLNTTGGESLVEPFLSIYNDGKEAFDALYAGGGREFRYYRVILGASSAASITPYYERAGTYYVAHSASKINKAADDTYTFTNLVGASDYAKPFATNVLSYFLHSGTACVGATAPCANVPPSGNTFRIGLAPNNTPGLTKPIIAFYVIADPRKYFPGVPY